MFNEEEVTKEQSLAEENARLRRLIRVYEAYLKRITGVRDEKHEAYLRMHTQLMVGEEETTDGL